MVLCEEEKKHWISNLEFSLHAADEKNIKVLCVVFGQKRQAKNEDKKKTSAGLVILGESNSKYMDSGIGTTVRKQ